MRGRGSYSIVYHTVVLQGNQDPIPSHIFSTTTRDVIILYNIFNIFNIDYRKFKINLNFK